MAQTVEKILEDDILDILQVHKALSLQELLDELQKRREVVVSSEVRAAVLPLINIQRIEFTNERKLKLPSGK